METKKNGARRLKVDKRKLTIRIIAWVLMLMMVITALYTAIYYIVVSVGAAEPDDGVSVAVGVLFGDNVDVAFTTTTTNGFVVGSETMGMYTKSFAPLWTLPDTPKISVLGDRNYYKSASNSYSFSETDVTVGSYHIQLDEVFPDADMLSVMMAQIDTALTGMYSIPSYINGEYRLRIGHFATEQEAESAAAEFTSIFTALPVSVASPTSTGVCVVEHATARILFEYDCGSSTYLALDAVDDEDGGEAYLRTPMGNIYQGVFVYKRYITDTKDGITLINVAPLEEYVAGVMPYEISNSWPLECQKAFSVSVRTYVLANMSKYWNSYGFNVCATANSQVYRGVARVNENVLTAVSETAGLVMTYNNSLAQVYYSSSTGNCTAAVQYVWGREIGWLQSVMTPWEDYMNHSNAFWTAEATPEELYTYLLGQGYTSLKAPIANVEINEYAGENSTYVYKITVTDEEGNSCVITQSNKVRNAFYKYLNSSNFTVGRGSVDYSVYKKLMPPDGVVIYKNVFEYAAEGKLLDTDGLFGVKTDAAQYNGAFADGISVLTANMFHEYKPEERLNVLTAESWIKRVAIGTTQGVIYDPDEIFDTVTATATDPNNFIFVGKGWGHGVGLSQWGLYDLANMGIDYLNMLTSYCPGTSVADYNNIIKY